MAITITFTNNIPLDIEGKLSSVSSSDVEDRAYDMIYSATESSGVISSIKQVGVCTATTATTITVLENTDASIGASLSGASYTTEVDLKDSSVMGIGVCSAVALGGASISYPAAGDFIFFAKNKLAQNNGLLGYYMQVQMRITPGSSTSTELFAVGTEVFESSK